MVSTFTQSQRRKFLNFAAHLHSRFQNAFSIGNQRHRNVIAQRHRVDLLVNHRLFQIFHRYSTAKKEVHFRDHSFLKQPQCFGRFAAGTPCRHHTTAAQMYSDRMRSLTSVSYTHLDVYKRQRLDRLALILFLFRQVRNIFQITEAFFYRIQLFGRYFCRNAFRRLFFPYWFFRFFSAKQFI